MKPVLKGALGLTLGASLMAVAAIAAAGDVTPQRQEQLSHLVRQDCGSCHGMTLKGGLGKPLRRADLAHLEAAAIAEVILDGIPGTPMPPWRGMIADDEARWIAQALKDGTIK